LEQKTFITPNFFRYLIVRKYKLLKVRREKLKRMTELLGKSLYVLKNEGIKGFVDKTKRYVKRRRY